MGSRGNERPGQVARGLTFGSVAEQYERHRLGYPDELADAVLDYAGRPVRTALEVGAGTGKATRLFAGRGIEVTAVEPDGDMAAVLRRTTAGLPVEPVASTFEGLVTPRRFDLVYAAAAWHWTDPATRWARAAGLLVPGGVLALFGRPTDLHDPELDAAVDAVEERVLPADRTGPQWTLEDMTAADGLADVEQRELPCMTKMTADDFVRRLATVSACLVLAPAVRADTLRRIRALLPDRVDIDASVRLRLARRT